MKDYYKSDFMKNTLKYTWAERKEMREKAFQKMISFCRAHPRSHQEIKRQLYTMGLWKWEVEQILSRLIADGKVSEEQFAKHFVATKLGPWGKMRIKQHLARQRVSAYNIKHVMKKIDDEEYRNTLYEMARQKWDSIRGADINDFIKMKKTSDYLLYKGYEYKLISEALDWLKTGEA
jgi:regulatory protein